MRTFPSLLAALTASLLACFSVEAATISEVSSAVCAQMTSHGVLKEAGPLTCDQLSIVSFSYLGFDGKIHPDGEIMVLDATAQHVRGIFEELLQRRFPIARARLMHHYVGDDAASMRDNNTSGFNHRAVTGGGPLSLHAYGLAIDLNPEQNPYIAFENDGRASVSPQAGIRYANRAMQRPGKPERSGMAEEAVSIFAWHGFSVWGGDWDNPIDYQHFQLPRALAERLARMPENEARAAFQRHVERYRDCMRTTQGGNAVCRQAK